MAQPRSRKIARARSSLRRRADGRSGRSATSPRKSTLRFAQFAIENVSDGAYWIEEDARITYANEAACRLTGYARDELLGMFIYDLNPDIPRDKWPEVWRLLKQAKKRTFETRHRRKDGRILPVEIAANYLEFDGKEYSCAFARDITDRKQLELRLRQAEKMEAVGQLAGGIAHDFNNQLMGIMGYADILHRRLADKPDLANIATNIRRSVRRAAELTTQLLAFSRKGVFVSECVDLHRVVAEVIELLAHTLDKRIIIERRLEAEIPFTSGDPTQLQSAVLNLALNARDAMPNGGTLTFSTENVVLDKSFGPEQLFPMPTGRFVRLTVSDTGEGMDARTQRRVFEPFFTTKAKGTGLGLAAVYGTVKTHKGAVTVRSEPGRGTQVQVHLPVTSQASALASPSDSPQQPDLRSRHVLLVEDEADLRDVTRQLLEDLGCRVTSFDDAGEALRYYQRCCETVDVVMLDMVMPTMNGREVFQAMRTIDPKIRALLASGYNIDQEARTALEQGARGFIQKPYDSHTLARKILEVLESR